ncbi:hypothetical protein [Streptomyces sp. NPDC052042]|uniref:hypothetical protein n=1 Tax=Streptomyces sp. NPDC052042 TaxID=3365683 RepID=UPI0037CDD45F
MDAEGHVMADERYEWLDKDAAEKLLRGEPAASLDGRPDTGAEELAAVLEAAARNARPATGELPGEAAALAAFRAAHSARFGTCADTGATSPGPTSAHAEVTGHAEQADAPVPVDVLDPVHIRPAAGVPVTAVASVPSAEGASATGSGRPRSRRRTRPLRLGLVASFAGCALGGVAVAAGAGVLPGPFGGHTPAPASSVSADASPDGVGSRDVTEAPPAVQPSASPDTPSATPPTGSVDPGGEDEERGNGDGRRSDGKPDGTPDGGAHSGAPAVPGGANSGRWHAKPAQACREYRDGDLDDEHRRYLEALANGARNLERFCDRILDKDEDKEGNGQKDQDDGDEQGGRNGSGDGERTAGNGNGGDNQGDNVNRQGGVSNRALPAIQVGTTPKKPPTPPGRSALPRASASVSVPTSPSTVPSTIPPSAGRTKTGATAGSPAPTGR